MERWPIQIIGMLGFSLGGDHVERITHYWKNQHSWVRPCVHLGRDLFCNTARILNPGVQGTLFIPGWNVIWVAERERDRFVNSALVCVSENKSITEPIKAISWPHYQQFMNIRSAVALETEGLNECQSCMIIFKHRLYRVCLILRVQCKENKTSWIWFVVDQGYI